MWPMPVEPGLCEGERLVDWLVDSAGLRAVAARACASAGIQGREEQVAYCLVVLVRKPDPPRRGPDGTKKRTFCLDPCTDGFAERLDLWADRIARNLSRWAATHDAIHDELDLFEIETLRKLIRSRVRLPDDLIDTLADELAGLVTRGPRLAEMSIQHARDFEPAPGEYAFQTPLSSWIATVVNRRKPWDLEPLDERAEDSRPRDVADDLDEAQEVAQDAERVLIARIGELARAGGLLGAAIERADELEREFGRQRAESREAAAALVRLRAELVHVADALSRERRAVTPMLAYVALAMPRARQLQRTSVLSLRAESIERPVVDSMSAAMSAIVRDEFQPTPALIRRTDEATKRGVARSRLKNLEELRDAPLRRADLLAPVERMLDELPPAVAGLAAIAADLDSDAAIVATNRNAAADELTSVDRWCGRVFRRYAMRKP